MTRKKPEIDVSKITKLIRLLASDKPGELIASVSALRRTLVAAGRDFHDLAEAIEQGLRPAPKTKPQRQRAASWAPPAPPLDDWQAMSWYPSFSPASAPRGAARTCRRLSDRHCLLRDRWCLHRMAPLRAEIPGRDDRGARRRVKSSVRVHM